MTLRACRECRRHFGTEPACPFCGTLVERRAARIGAPARMSRAAIFAALSGCYTSSPPPQGPPPPPPPPHEDQGPQQFATPPDTRPPDETAPVASARGRIEGVVTASDGSGPMQQLHVQLSSTEQPPRIAQRATTTDASGHYAFDQLPPGQYLLEVGYRNHPRRPPPQRRITLAQDATQKVDVSYYIAPHSNVPMPYGAPPARRRIV